MAKLSVWLHTGMTIPSTGMQTNTADGTDALVYYDGTRGTGGWVSGSVIGDGYAELSGSEAAIKNDYKLLTGYTLGSIPKDTQPGLNAGASGSYFGPERDLSQG